MITQISIQTLVILLMAVTGMFITMKAFKMPRSWDKNQTAREALIKKQLERENSFKRQQKNDRDKQKTKSA